MKHQGFEITSRLQTWGEKRTPSKAIRQALNGWLNDVMWTLTNIESMDSEIVVKVKRGRASDKYLM